MITMPDNINNFDTSTTGSSVSDIIPTTPSVTFDFKDEFSLHSMELLLKKNYFIHDDIFSVDDVLLFDSLCKSKTIIIQKKHPSIYRWCNELERLKQNWRISRKKNKGNSFIEYIKQMGDKLQEEKVQFKENTPVSLLKEEFETKIDLKCHSTASTSPKKKEYKMEIAVYFKEDERKNWNVIASVLSIICQAYLPRDMELRPVIDEDEKGIHALIITRTHKETYDMMYLEQDVKRNINAVEYMKIVSIKEDCDGDGNSDGKVKEDRRSDKDEDDDKDKGNEKYDVSPWKKNNTKKDNE